MKKRPSKEDFRKRIAKPEPGDRGDKIHGDIWNSPNLASSEKKKLLRDLDLELARKGKKPQDPLT